jgi:hypothetical protein
VGVRALPAVYKNVIIKIDSDVDYVFEKPRVYMFKKYIGIFKENN